MGEYADMMLGGEQEKARHSQSGYRAHYEKMREAHELGQTDPMEWALCQSIMEQLEPQHHAEWLKKQGKAS
ncbi:MAG: hypothetical protein GYB49_09360 [Alphaproteobacteria bacterium]|nr:hypothetical protein [Hyphomonas sp.]MBR9807416.1 hypothetical protein [Alphaproteobacteria bacterium]